MMFKNSLKIFFQPRLHVKGICVGSKCNVNVAVCGATGGVGQSLCLLLKESSLVTNLSLYDMNHTMGVTVDLSHIDTKCRVKGFVGQLHMKEAFKGADVIVVTSGVPRKPGMSRDDLFNTNAEIIKTVAEAAARSAPKALLAIVTNPLNVVVPIASEVYKKIGVYDPNKIFGVTTLDIVRANTLVGEAKCIDPSEVEVPVIGGHTNDTMVPMFSQTQPKSKFSDEEIQNMTIAVQEGGTQVVKAKAGTGSATLSTAHAAARFTFSLCRALLGKPSVECAYVRSTCTEATYFSTPLLISSQGIERNLGFGNLSPFENKLYNKAIPVLKKQIAKGESFIKGDGKCKD